MKIQTIILSLMAVFFLNGCSALKAKFLSKTSIPTNSIKPIEYNFSQPRRGTLSSNMLVKLNDPKIIGGAYRYFSANGHECRNISTDLSHTACKVNGEWKESAPILVVKIP